MAGCAINGDFATNREADVAQAEYYRQELSRLRAQAQADLARNYIELQHLETSDPSGRAANVRKLVRALQSEIATLERLGQELARWL